MAAGELVGPFSVRDGEDNYQLYLIRPASGSQSDFINLLFDRPLLLLIVTMLVSTPPAAVVGLESGKPAQLKTLPMKLPRETYASTRNWKRGHRNSCRRCQF